MRLCPSIVMAHSRLIITKNISVVKSKVGLYDSPHPHVPVNPNFLRQNYTSFLLTRMRVPPIVEIFRLEGRRTNKRFQALDSLSVGNQGDLSDSLEDDGTCPVDCVREFNTDEEFLRILEKANKTNSLVVVDFYRTSCGSCKYIEQGFAKLCKGSGDHEDAVIFLKHNVIDEYDEQSEVAERLRIRSVPLFHFYKDGILLEAFPTRDKERIIAAINKYISPPH